jgi:hypothetical protein
MNTVPARFIGCGGNHATPGRISRAANDKRFAPELGTALYLNSGKKCVHINMKDPSHGIL